MGGLAYLEEANPWAIRVVRSLSGAFRAAAKRAEALTDTKMWSNETNSFEYAEKEIEQCTQHRINTKLNRSLII